MERAQKGIAKSLFDGDCSLGACADASHAYDAVLHAGGYRFPGSAVICDLFDVEDVHGANIGADAVSVANFKIYNDIGQDFHL